MSTKHLAAVAVSVLVALQTPSAARPAVKVPDKVASKAQPFDLAEVRLLEGPFRDAMIRDQQYLLSLDPDRLLHNFRVTAGLPSSAQPLGGWEAPDVELRGHTVGHYLSALSLMYATTGDARFKDRADLMVAGLGKVQDAEARKFHPGYLSAFPEEFFDRVDARQKVWAPYYTIHKIMAGLLDAYALAGNQQALEILKKKADWVKFRVDRLTEEQQQAALQTEFGGMNEVLANLYAATGDPEYLRVARKFDHKVLFDPLSRGVDPLNGLHANTQIPKMIGAAREYELTGETRYHDIASFFWDTVVHRRSYVIGGNSDGEAFFPPEQFSQHLGASSAETCNTYNMLKLTRHMFQWAPSAETMDFYERGLFNHILGSQDPATGMMIYYCPLRPGAFKVFSTPTDSFWCCVGTGMENHAKYTDTIYFHDADSLYLNLFLPSELTWKEKGLTVTQHTRFPEEDTTRLTFKADRPIRIPLLVRYPKWATSLTAKVNGGAIDVSGTPGSYVSIAREWKTNDTLELTLPMTLRTEAMPDNPKVLAFLSGPVVLAGDLGKSGLESVKRYGPNAPPMGRVKTPVVPALVADDPAALVRHVQPAGAPLTFKTVGLGRPSDVTLLPFYKVMEPRYTVYWNVYTPAEWRAHEADLAAAAAKRREIEKATTDSVDVASDASESAHAFKSGGTIAPGFLEGRRYRETGDGFFSYDLKIQPDKPVTLVCSYRGSEGRRRTFDIIVDGEKIATETLEYDPTQALDREYQIPSRLTQGKSTITVRFQPQPGARTGGVLEIRTVQGSTKS